MKIIAVYRSETYSQSTERKIMVWPDSAMILSRKPLFLPESESLEFFIALGVKITAVGKSIKKRFAGRYYDSVHPMIFILGEDSAKRVKCKEDPYASDIVRDYSVVCGDAIPYETASEYLNLNISMMELAGREFSNNAGNIDLQERGFDFIISGYKDSIAEAIETASLKNTLKTGDMVAFLAEESFPCRQESLLKICIGNSHILLETKFK